MFHQQLDVHLRMIKLMNLNIKHKLISLHIKHKKSLTKTFMTIYI